MRNYRKALEYIVLAKECNDRYDVNAWFKENQTLDCKISTNEITLIYATCLKKNCHFEEAEKAYRSLDKVFK